MCWCFSPSPSASQVVVSAAVTRVFSHSIEVAVRVSSNSVNTQDTPTEVGMVGCKSVKLWCYEHSVLVLVRSIVSLCFFYESHIYTCGIISMLLAKRNPWSTVSVIKCPLMIMIQPTAWYGLVWSCPFCIARQHTHTTGETEWNRWMLATWIFPWWARMDRSLPECNGLSREETNMTIPNINMFLWDRIRRLMNLNDNMCIFLYLYTHEFIMTLYSRILEYSRF